MPVGTNALILANLMRARTPEKPKRGRPRKRIRFPKVGEGRTLLSFEGWSYDRKGNPVPPSERRKRGQRKVTSKYTKEDVEWLRDRVEKQQANARKSGKRISIGKALTEDMIEHRPTLIEDLIQYYLTRLPQKASPRIEHRSRPVVRAPDSTPVIWEGRMTTWGALTADERAECERNKRGVLEGRAAEAARREIARRVHGPISSDKESESERRAKAEVMAWKYVNKYVKRCQMILSRRKR